MITTLDERFKVPSRTHFRETVIPNMYNGIRDKVMEELDHAHSCSLTTDEWTSRSQDGYITTTVHFLDDSWRLQSRMLDTNVIHEAHTGQNLGRALKNTADKWGTNKIPGFNSVTTDNPSVMTNAVRESVHDIYVGCFAHTINLATKKALEVTV